MTISLTGLLILLLIAGICGAIGRAIGGGTGSSFRLDRRRIHRCAARRPHRETLSSPPSCSTSPSMVSPFPILWSILGAALFVALVHLISGRSVRMR